MVGQNSGGFKTSFNDIAHGPVLVSLADVGAMTSVDPIGIGDKDTFLHNDGEADDRFGSEEVVKSNSDRKDRESTLKSRRSFGYDGV